VPTNWEAIRGSDKDKRRDHGIDVPTSVALAYRGDMTRDRQHRTENRRRRHVWAKAAQQAHESGDLELARLLNYAENEINSTGFVAESTARQLEMVISSRGFER